MRTLTSDEVLGPVHFLPVRVGNVEPHPPEPLSEEFDSFWLRCRCVSFVRLQLLVVSHHVPLVLHHVKFVSLPASPTFTFLLHLHHTIIIRLSKMRKDPLSTLKRTRLLRWRPIPCFLSFQRYVHIQLSRSSCHRKLKISRVQSHHILLLPATTSLEPRPALTSSRAISPWLVASLPPFRSC